MSALRPKAAMCSATRYVCFVPIAEIATLAKLINSLSDHIPIRHPGHHAYV
jgi:hypothetical protein